jgi:hypothetical protein
MRRAGFRGAIRRAAPVQAGDRIGHVFGASRVPSSDTHSYRRNPYA